MKDEIPTAVKVEEKIEIGHDTLNIEFSTDFENNLKPGDELVRRKDVVELIQSFEDEIFKDAPKALPSYRKIIEAMQE